MTPEEIAAQEAEKAKQAEEEAKAAQEAEAKKKTPQTVEELQAQLEKERKERQEANAEAQKHRQALRKYEEDEKKRQEADMSELEKAQAKIAELSEQNTANAAKALNSAIMSMAVTLGFNDPNDAVAMIDRASIDAEQGNIKQLLEKVVKEKPYLVKAESGLPKQTQEKNPAEEITRKLNKETATRMTGLFPALKRRLGQ
jgi:hypothetical protein